MIKYVYQIVDNKGKTASSHLISSRAHAREVKRNCEHYTQFQKLLGETPPYKIIRYELTKPKVVR